MTTEQDLGFPADDAKAATDYLREPIQSCLLDFQLSEVTIAIAQVFFGLLYDAHRKETHIKDWLRKLANLHEKPSKNAIKTVSIIIGDPVNRLIVNEKISPLAIAFSLASALVSIIRQLPVVTDDRANEFMRDLLTHINIAKSQ